MIIPLKIKAIFDLLQAGAEKQVITNIIATLIGISVILFLTRSLSRILCFVPGRLFEHKLRNMLFQKLIQLSYTFYKQHKIGDIISRVSNDIQNIRLSLALGLLHIVNTLFIFPFTLYQMIQISPRLTLYILLPIPVSLFFIRFFVSRLYKTIKTSQESLGRVTEFLIESFNNLMTIKHYTVQNEFMTQFEEYNKALFIANINQSKISSKMFPFISIISSIGYFVLFIVGGKMIIDRQLTVGDFVALSLYLSLLAWPTASLAWIINILQRGKSAWERIKELLDSNDILALDYTHNVTLQKKCSIELKNLSFKIDNTKILDSISLSIPFNTKIGIFGPSGSGKTTLLRILAGLEHIPAETYFIDDIPIHDYSLSQIHEDINFIPQTPILFSDSIRNNIHYRDCDIDELLTKASLTSDIASFPDGLETVIGEKGVILSGGQQSRVALARAFSKPSSILILDDIFSAVDSETEKQISHHLFQSYQKSSIVIVSHRISTLSQCDIIYILENGKITASGDHNALLVTNSYYKKTWEYQQILDSTHE